MTAKDDMSGQQPRHTSSSTAASTSSPTASSSKAPPPQASSSHHRRNVSSSQDHGMLRPVAGGAQHTLPGATPAFELQQDPLASLSQQQQQQVPSFQFSSPASSPQTSPRVDASAGSSSTASGSGTFGSFSNGALGRSGSLKSNLRDHHHHNKP